MVTIPPLYGWKTDVFRPFFVWDLSAMPKNRTYNPWETCWDKTVSNFGAEAENQTYAPRVSCFANVDPNFVAKPRNRTHDTLVTMDVTLLFLGQFSSVLPLFGVARKMQDNGHHPTPLWLKKGRKFFLSPAQVACLGIKLMTLLGLRFNSRSQHLIFVTRLSYSTLPGPGIELMTLCSQWT